MLPVAFFRKRQGTLERLIRSFVEMESPTSDKEAVDAFSRVVASRAKRTGATVTRYPKKSVGDQALRVWGNRGRGGVLLLTHLDTVHPAGTLAQMPWRATRDRLFGPGIADMKASIAMALFAIGTLRETRNLPARRISLFCNSDEETGSATSRSLIEKLAKEHDIALCLETGLPDGSLKTERRGAGSFLVEIRGRAAHAGADPDSGINAIVEMAHQIERIAGFGGRKRGTALNVGIVEGGVRRNIVPDFCRIEVDVRISRNSERRRIEAAFRSLAPSSRGATLSAEGKWHRPVMERTPEIANAFACARQIALRLGIHLRERAAGGSSDANFVAALGLPVLDGIGAIGGGTHSEREYIVRGRLAERAALLAALIGEWFPRSET